MHRVHAAADAEMAPFVCPAQTENRQRVPEAVVDSVHWTYSLSVQKKA